MSILGRNTDDVSGANLDGKSPSEQQRSAEWTKENVIGHTWQEIVGAHNAALTAERQRRTIVWEHGNADQRVAALKQ